MSKEEQLVAESLGLVDKSERRKKDIGKPAVVKKQYMYCNFCLADVVANKEGLCPDCKGIF